MNAPGCSSHTRHPGDSAYLSIPASLSLPPEAIPNLRQLPRSDSSTTKQQPPPRIPPSSPRLNIYCAYAISIPTISQQDAPPLHPLGALAPPKLPPVRTGRGQPRRRPHEPAHRAAAGGSERRALPAVKAAEGPHRRVVGRPFLVSGVPVADGSCSILLGFFFSCLDAAIVATSLVSISEDLGEFANIHWVILAYLLSYMGENLPAPRAAGCLD